MRARVAAIKRSLKEAYAAQEAAVGSGDVEALRVASEKARTSELVLHRLQGERLARPVYLAAGFVLMIAGALALAPLQRPNISLSATTSAVALQTGVKEVNILPRAVGLSSLQIGQNRLVEACQERCTHSRIEVSSLRANAGTSMHLRAEGGCLILDVTKGFVSVESVNLLRADSWELCRNCGDTVVHGQTLRMCGLDASLIIPVSRVVIADTSRPVQDAAASPALIEGTLNLVDLGSKHELPLGTLIEVAELSDGYATVVLARELGLRVSGRAGKVLIGSEQRDARPSLLETVTRAPRLLEWSSLVTGLMIFVIGLRGRLRRASEIFEGDL